MRKVLCISLLLTMFALSVIAPAQMLRSDSEMRADPKDIREIFLTLPWPTGEKDSLAGITGEKAADINQRKRLLYDAASGKTDSLLDPTDGYLKISLGENYYIVNTYFQKANGDRLVILQLDDANVPDDLPARDDFMFTLSQGSYQREPLSKILPTIKFEDFWGLQPEPASSIKRLISPDPCFRIEWPRKGTIARAIYIEPYFDTEGKTEKTAEAVANKREFDEVGLVWDKQKGVFTKGQYKHHKKV